MLRSLLAAATEAVDHAVGASKARRNGPTRWLRRNHFSRRNLPCNNVPPSENLVKMVKRPAEHGTRIARHLYRLGQRS